MEPDLMMRHFGIRVITAGLLAMSWQACAADGSSINCADLTTGFEQKQCAEIRLGKASEELREVYQRALQRAADTEARLPPTKTSDEKSRAVAISESQRSWETYRDAECRGVVGRGGGSGRAVWILGCLAEKTNERARELNVPFDQR